MLKALKREESSKAMWKSDLNAIGISFWAQDLPSVQILKCRVEARLATAS